MKPLYISNTTQTEVSLRGTALRIKSEQRAAAVISTRFISRIISTCKVQWHGEALRHCMQNGIPIVFTDNNGDIAGFLHGTSANRQPSLIQRLRETLAHPYGIRQYKTWLRGMTSRRKVKICAALGIPGDRFRIHQMQQQILAYRDQLASPWLIKLLDMIWQQAIAGLVAEELKTAGLSAEQQQCIWNDINMVEDLRELMYWEMHIPACQILPTLELQLQQSNSGHELKRSLLQAYNNQAFQIQVILHDALHRLDQCLRDMHEF